MKKTIPLMLILVSLNGLAQERKWFVSVSTGMNFGGQGASVSTRMKEQGYDDTNSGTIFFFPIETEYPLVTGLPNIMLRAARDISDRKSLFIIAGIADRKTVTGFKATGWSNSLLVTGTTGIQPVYKGILYQLASGILFQPGAGRRLMFGTGPSLYLLSYKLEDEINRDSGIKFLPGLCMTGKFSLGKHKRRVGIDLVTDINLAPPAVVRDKPGANAFRLQRVGLMGGQLGFALSLRS